jgi:hypothetical protein
MKSRDIFEKAKSLAKEKGKHISNGSYIPLAGLGGDVSLHEDSYILKKSGFVIKYEHNLAVYPGSEKKETPNETLEIYKKGFFINQLIFSATSTAFKEKYKEEFRKSCLIDKFTKDISKKFEELTK